MWDRPDVLNRLADLLFTTAVLAVAIARARHQPDDDLAARIHGRCIMTSLSAALDNWYVEQARTPLIDKLRQAADALAALGSNSGGAGQ